MLTTKKVWGAVKDSTYLTTIKMIGHFNGSELENKEEVEICCKQNLEKVFEGFFEDFRDAIAKDFMPDYDKYLDDDLVEAIEKWQPDFKEIKEKMEE